MTINNLELALQLNNNRFINEINIIIAYLNSFFTNTKILNEDLQKQINDINSDLIVTNAHIDYQIDEVNTRFNRLISDLADDYGDHKLNTVIHVTQSDKDRWNAGTAYTDAALAQHTNNLVIHVTQEDKDLWNATLQNAKDYAKALFDRLTSFEITKCTELPTEDIHEMTIYFLQIDPEQSDLYEEYMYIDNKWEKIGNTRIDLSDYVTKSLLNSTIASVNRTIQNKENSLLNLLTMLENKHNNDIKWVVNRNELANVAFSGDYRDLKHAPEWHTHDNKATLDGFSTDKNGILRYNDEEVLDRFTEQDVTQLITQLWGTPVSFITSDNKEFETSDGYVLITKRGGSL
jgi:hypothetical protein